MKKGPLSGPGESYYSDRPRFRPTRIIGATESENKNILEHF